MAPKVRGSGLPASPPRRSPRLRRIGPDSGPPTSAASPQVLEDSKASSTSSAAPVSTDSDSDLCLTPPVQIPSEVDVLQALKQGTLHRAVSTSMPKLLDLKQSPSFNAETSCKRKASSSHRSEFSTKKPKSSAAAQKSPSRLRPSESAVCKDGCFSPCFANSLARTIFLQTVSARPPVFERPFDLTSLPPLFSTLITRLGWKQVLQSLPRPNLSIVHEFYSNFPDSLPETMDLFASSGGVYVRGLHILFSPTVIRHVLHLPVPSDSAVVQATRFLSDCDMSILVDKLYSSIPRLTPSFLSSGQMDEWFRLLGFLVRTFLHPT